MWSNLTACRPDHMIGRQSLKSRRRFTSEISEVAVQLNAAAVVAECQVTRGLMTPCRGWNQRSAATTGYRFVPAVRVMPLMKTSRTDSAMRSTSAVVTPQRGK